MSCTTIPSSLRKQAEDSKFHQARAAELSRENAALEERVKELQLRCGELQDKCESLETSEASALESVSVADAERKLLSELLERADATIAELRAERTTLISQQGELHAADAKRSESLLASEHERARLDTELGVARAERKLVDEEAARRASQHDEAVRRAKDADARALALETSLEALRDKWSSLHEELAVSRVERRVLDESMSRLAEHHTADGRALQTRISTAEAREHNAVQAKTSADEERSAALTSLTVAQAERRILQELGARLQEQLQEDRASAAAAQQRSDEHHRVRSFIPPLVTRGMALVTRGMPLVTRGMPLVMRGMLASPNRPWCHVASLPSPHRPWRHVAGPH